LPTRKFNYIFWHAGWHTAPTFLTFIEMLKSLTHFVCSRCYLLFLHIFIFFFFLFLSPS
jgi:hypothetical protein